MKIIVVDNPKSGSATPRKDLRAKCQAAGIEIEKFISIGDGFDKKLSPFIKKKALIAAIGGDGTISGVAEQVAGTKATLIPLPGGTLNHFTKDLGVPQDLEKALDRLKKLQPRLIDVAKVNDQVFINNSSLGLYPASLRSREEMEDKIGKWPAAVAASWHALVRFKTYHLTIKGRSVTTPFIFVGNNRYMLDGGGTSRTRLDEGTLTVFVAHTKSRVALFKIALFALLGKTKDLSEFDEYYLSELSIKTKRSKIHVSHDGEVSKMTSPLHYIVEKKSLQIIA